MLRDHLDVIQRFAAVQKNPHHLLETKALDNLAAQSWGHESRRPNIKKPARRAPWRFRNYRWLREDATDDRCGMGAQMQKPPRRGQRRFRNYRWLRGQDLRTVSHLQRQYSDPHPARDQCPRANMYWLRGHELDTVSQCGGPSISPAPLPLPDPPSPGPSLSPGSASLWQTLLYLRGQGAGPDGCEARNLRI